jgi:hypothetical protein
MTKFLSRKFIIAGLFAITGCSAFLFTGKLTGGEFITLALGIAGLFGAGDVAINAIHKRNSEDAPKE